MGRRRRKQPASGLVPLLLLALAGLALVLQYWYWILGILACYGLVRRLLAQARRARTRAWAAGLDLSEIDALDGIAFEEWITAYLDGEGFHCLDIRHSGDFGVDVIAERKGLRIGIQAKNYQGHVGNDAVQQALAGCDYHGCSVASVVTQSTYTRAAREQAAHAHLPVILIDRERLPRMAQIFRDYCDRPEAVGSGKGAS